MENLIGQFFKSLSSVEALSLFGTAFASLIPIIIYTIELIRKRTRSTVKNITITAKSFGSQIKLETNTPDSIDKALNFLGSFPQGDKEKNSWSFKLRATFQNETIEIHTSSPGSISELIKTLEGLKIRQGTPRVQGKNDGQFSISTTIPKTGNRSNNGNQTNYDNAEVHKPQPAVEQPVADKELTEADEVSLRKDEGEEQQSIDGPTTHQATTTTDSDTTATTRQTSADVEDTDEARRLILHDEQLSLYKQPIQTGEVGLHKEVVNEQKSINVPVTHEEVYIERRPDSGNVSDTQIGEGETIRVPVSAEQVQVNKQTVESSEVALHKHGVQEKQQVKDTLHHEEAHVERLSDVDVKGTDTTASNQ